MCLFGESWQYYVRVTLENIALIVFMFLHINSIRLDIRELVFTQQSIVKGSVRNIDHRIGNEN